LVGLDIVQLRKEANLRSELIRARANAEPIAMHRNERNGEARLAARVLEMIASIRVIISLNRNLAFFTKGYNYLVQLIPVLIVAPIYIRGDIEFGKVTQAAMAFSFVMNAFSLIVKEFQRISTFGAVVERLGSFCEVLAEETAVGCKRPLETVEDANRVAFEGLTLLTPRDGRVLVQDLS